MLAAVIAEGVALFLLALLVAGLLRSHAEILRALHDLGAGIDPDGAQPPARRPEGPTATISRSSSPAHDVVGLDRHGATAAVAVSGAEHDTLLAFLSTGCDTCRPFWSALRAGVDLPGVRIVVVVADEESESVVQDLAGENLDVIASSAAWTAYDVPGSPHFVYVDGSAGRVVGEGTGPDWPAVRSLLLQANADRAVREQPRRRTQDVEWRDNPTRIDAELLAAGIGPGHPSLVGPPEAGAD